jgi:hypothetical protein
VYQYSNQLESNGCRFLQQQVQQQPTPYMKSWVSTSLQGVASGARRADSASLQAEAQWSRCTVLMTAISRYTPATDVRLAGIRFPVWRWMTRMCRLSMSSRTGGAGFHGDEAMSCNQSPPGAQ